MDQHSFEEVRAEIEKIADKLIQWGVSPSLVWKHLQPLELDAVRSKSRMDRIESIQALLPIIGAEATAERCGVCKATVYNAVKKSKKTQDA